MNKNSTHILGIDIGTSGIRLTVVKRPLTSSTQTTTPNESIVLTLTHSFAPEVIALTQQSSEIWIAGLKQLLIKLSQQFDLNKVNHIIADATSSTVLLTDLSGQPLTPALMYHSHQAQQEAQDLMSAYPQVKKSAAYGTTSSLAKTIWLYKHYSAQQCYVCHQIDLINQFLGAPIGISDYNNVLKLGYDPITQTWPEWMLNALDHFSPQIMLPKVVAPGEVLSMNVSSELRKMGFRADTSIHAGSTDSIAAFLASGAHQVGEAVSALGSSLAIKQLSSQPIVQAELGLYSHKFFNAWLVGGASNVGGKVIRHYYNYSEMSLLNSCVEHLPHLWQHSLSQPYHPLLERGERFPVNDATLQALLPPIPQQPLTSEDVSHLTQLLEHSPTQIQEQLSPHLQQHLVFYAALCSGTARVEAQSYQALQALGAEATQAIYAVGNGQKNRLWQAARKHYLNAELKQAHSNEAAYGVTRFIKLQHLPKDSLC